MAEQAEKTKLTPVFVVALEQRNHVSAFPKQLQTPEEAKEMAKEIALKNGGTYGVWKLVARVRGGKLKPKPIPEGMCQCRLCGGLVNIHRQIAHANKNHSGKQSYRYGTQEKPEQELV